MNRALCCWSLFAVAVLSVSTAVFAETALEARVISQPMPHATAGGGKTVLAHWVKSAYSAYTAQHNAKVLADARRQVQECLSNPDRATMYPNIPANPPKEWPNQMAAQRVDHYVTRNYRIIYIHTWIYAVDHRTCGWLNEHADASASLESRAGSCAIDLDKRTAKGVCDFALHQKAAPSLGPKMPANAPRLPLTPAQEQVARVGKATVTATRERKMIAGHDCTVFVDNFGGFRYCNAKAGSFHVSRIAGEEVSLPLEVIGPAGDEKRALEAYFDVEVGEQVFAPHLRGGFKIELRKPLTPYSSPSP